MVNGGNTVISGFEGSILVMPNFTKPFVVETDASGAGIGAVLTQDNHPVAFYSQVLGVRNQIKSIYEKELMGIVLAVKNGLNI